MNRTPEAKAAAQESVTVYEQLTAVDPATYGPQLKQAKDLLAQLG